MHVSTWFCHPETESPIAQRFRLRAVDDSDELSRAKLQPPVCSHWVALAANQKHSLRGAPRVIQSPTSVSMYFQFFLCTSCIYVCMWGSAGVAPLIPNLGTIGRDVGFTF